MIFTIKCWTITFSFSISFKNISFPQIKNLFLHLSTKRHSVSSGKHKCLQIEFKKGKWLFYFWVNCYIVTGIISGIGTDVLHQKHLYCPAVLFCCDDAVLSTVLYFVLI